MAQQFWKWFLFIWMVLVAVFCTPPDSSICNPSPCGPYSICKEESGHGACYCEEGCVGSPPECKPECLINTECPPHQACMWRRCKNPCLEVCGVNALCQFENNLINCTCPHWLSGDPYILCDLEPTPEIVLDKGKTSVVAKFNESLKRQCLVTNLGTYWHIKALEWRQAKLALKLTETCVEPDRNKWNFHVTCAADFPTAGVPLQCFYKDSTWMHWKSLSNSTFDGHRTTIFSKHLKDDDVKSFPQFFCKTDFEGREIISNVVPNVSFINKCESDTVNWDSDEENNNENNSSKTDMTTIWYSVGVLSAVFGAGLTTGLIYRNLCRSTTPTDSAQPSEEPEYSYVPIEMRSMYEARALLASNKKLGPAAFVPALPPRENDYDYI